MSPRYTDNIADVIVQNSDLISIISEYIQLKKTGRNVKGLCPFHNEKTPSFVVSEEKQLYHCFGCGAAGSVIQFIMQIENLDFIDAIELIAEKSHIDLSQYEVTSTSHKTDRKTHDDLVEITREAAIFFYKQLKDHDNKAVSYFNNRGINSETMREFGLGYAPDGWDNLIKYLKGKKYKEIQMEKAGLIIKRNSGNGYYDRFRDRVMFPIMDIRGRVIGFGGRVLDDSLPKYLNSPESEIFDKSQTLYGLNIAKKAVRDNNQIIVVEGYMDVISLHRKGIENVVATLGTALTKGHGNLLRRYAEEAIIAYDSDEAGQNAIKRSLETLESTGLKVRVLDMQDCKDPDELIIKYGQEFFEDQIKHAMTATEFQLKLAKQESDLDTNDGKIKYMEKAIIILKKIKNDTEKSVYAGKLADEMNIDRKTIENEIMTHKNYRKSTENQNSNYPSKQFEKKITKKDKVKKQKNEIENRVLQLMLLNAQTFKEILNQIDLEWINEQVTKDCIAGIEEYYKNEEVMLLDKLIDYLEIDELSYLKEIMVHNIPINDIKKEMELISVNLKTLHLEKKIKELSSEMGKISQNINLDNREDTAIMKRMLNDYYKELVDTRKRMVRQ